MLSVLPSRKMGYNLEALESTSVMVGTAKERPDEEEPGVQERLRFVQFSLEKQKSWDKIKLNLEEKKNLISSWWSRSPTTKIYDFKELKEVFVWYVLRDSKKKRERK